MTAAAHVAGPTDVPLVTDTIPTMFGRVVDSYPDRAALVVAFQDVRLTYRQLADEVDRVARGLVALGVQAGDRVGMWSPNNAEWVYVQFAVASVGAILVNLNPAYRTDELTYAVAQSGCRVLIAARRFKSSDYVAMVAAARPDLPDLEHVVFLDGPDWDELLAAGDHVDQADVEARHGPMSAHVAANIQYTSGTTGSPKGATLSHHNLVNNALFVGQRFAYTDQDRVCIPVPFYHCFGTVIGTLAAVTHGATIVLPAESFDAEATLRTIQDESCTSVLGVPTMFIGMLAHPAFTDFDLSTLRTGMMAGAPCPAEVMRRVVDEMHLPDITIGYGMTETSPISTQTSAGDSFDHRVHTVGRVHPHVEVKIVDPDSGATVGLGEAGELCTRGYSIMLGYWDDPERTAEAVDDDGWMHTGDLATIGGDGYVRVVGRVKDLIIRGGENISPREIEEFLHGMPGIVDVQVIGVPDPLYGEEVMAWIRVDDGVGLTRDDVVAFSTGRIAHYKIPRYVHVTDDFPMTVTGKIQKYKLRDLAIDVLGSGDEHLLDEPRHVERAATSSPPRPAVVATVDAPGQRVRRVRTTVLAALAILVAVGSMVALRAGPGAAAGNVADRPSSVPALDWVECGDGLQCATIDVPLDHDRPRGQQISLAVARVPATDPSQRIGSLFVNNGGPGNSVIDFVRGDARDVVPAGVQARFDIVGFDPRGVGRSSPVRCFADTEAQQEFFGSLPPFPVTDDEVAAAVDAAHDLGSRCQQRNGDLLDHLSTANVARDMDLLRRAVGDEQLTFAGYSYGGLLGITYAQLHPGNVRALLLDGAPDPIAWTTGRPADRRQPFSVRVGSATATGDAMGFFLDSCHDAGTPSCAFASDDTRGKFDELMARLRSGPITVDLPAGPDGPGGPTTVTYAFVADGLRGGLQFPPIWADLAGLLQATFAASDTVPSQAAGPTSVERTVEDEPGIDYDNSREAVVAVACSETNNPSSAARWTATAAAADERTAYFGAPWTWLSLPCAAWPGTDRDRMTGAFDRPTVNPVMFVNSRFDAANPYERAVANARRTPGARLLSVEGAGHPASFIPNECLADAVGRYLIEQQLPEPDAVCAADILPFPLAADAAQDTRPTQEQLTASVAPASVNTHSSATRQLAALSASTVARSDPDIRPARIASTLRSPAQR